MTKEVTHEEIREALQFLVARPEFKALLLIQESMVERLQNSMFKLDPAADKFISDYAYLKGQIEAFTKLRMELDEILTIKKDK